MPIEVLIVTLIVHRLLAQREKKALMEKLNMLIGTFYSEAGSELMILISSIDPGLEELKQNLDFDVDWNRDKYLAVSKAVRLHNYDVSADAESLQKLKGYILAKRDFMIGLLQNPNLLEHEGFTGLLRAVFHLIEEFSIRHQLNGLPEADLEHIEGDIKRVYVHLIKQWIYYMHYLSKSYPYLFSLAIRTNPFAKTQNILVR